MNLTHATAVVAFVGVAAFGAAPARATETSAKCTNVDAVMHAVAVKSVATGYVDRDFARAMIAQTNAMMALAKFEIDCGNDARAKIAARAFLDDAKERMKTMDLIAHTN